ncbi:MAG: cupin domain-containing protein [Candidatus Bathyarchaeia archaeon]
MKQSGHSKDRRRVRVYRFSDVPATWLNKHFSRRIIHGKHMTITYAIFEENFVPAHKHPDSEMMSIILKGAIKFNINGKERLVRAGEAILIPPNTMHSASTTEETVELCCFSPPRLRKDFSSKVPLVTSK